MRISFIVCTFNGSERISNTLDSIIKVCSGHDDAELLVVDNASTDNTSLKVSQLMNGVKINWRLLHEAVPGKANALALAFREAKGEYFSIIDDDNVILEEQWIQMACSFLEDNDNVGLIGPKILGILPNGSGRDAYESDPLWQGMLGVRDLGDKIKQGVIPIGAGMTGRTAPMSWLYSSRCTYLCDRVGNKLTSGEDHEKGYFYRMLGWETVYLPDLRLGHLIPSRRLRQEYIDAVFIGASQAYYWLISLHSRQLSFLRVCLGLVFDLMRVLRFIFVPPLGILKKGNRRSSSHWRRYYYSRASGAYDLLRQWGVAKNILKTVSEAPKCFKSPGAN